MTEERNCEVCGNYGPLYVASSGIVAATFAYCGTCVAMGREPYDIVVSLKWTTGEDAYENMDAYLRSLGKHRLDYEKDVEQSRLDFVEMMMMQTPEFEGCEECYHSPCQCPDEVTFDVDYVEVPQKEWPF